MRRLSPLLFVGIGACGTGGGDNTIDITHDACAPLILRSLDATTHQAAGIANAIALWRGRGAPALIAGAVEDALGASIELRFESAATAFRGLYDDETGIIYINSALAGDSLSVVIAHELGHAFGLEHTSNRASVMTPGNVTTLPTDGDQAALETLWGRCSASPTDGSIKL